ncbi:MAG: VCBS repeat-containing protein, partial [Planctomycetes bacterium]|nr:VCBS repeat-containing protein [Planctomycetota bacterium]
RREAEVAAGIQHPHVVRVYQSGEEGGLLYFTMDYVEGRSLKARVEEGNLPPEGAALLVQKVALAVSHLHEHGIIHRDLKPPNVMVRPDGEPVLMDFGLARRLAGEKTLTVSEAILGTPSYMSPEQALGKTREVGPVSDVYGLGGILYYAITGQPPFLGTTVENILYQVIHREPVAPRAMNPAVPRDLEVIALKCLSKEPGRRYASAGALAADLGRFLGGESISARPPSLAEKAWRVVKKNRLATAVTATVALTALGLGIWWWLTPGEVVFRDAPKGARVEIGDRELVATGEERQALELPAGVYDYRVTLADHEPEEGSLQVRRRGSREVSIDLKHEQGTLEVEAVPGGGEIEDNGLAYGSRIRNLPVDTGDHRLRARLEGHFVQERTVQVAWKQLTALRLFMDEGILWQKEESGDIQAAMEIGDLNQDGRGEILYVASTSLVCLSGADGTELWREAVPLYSVVKAVSLGGEEGEVLLAGASGTAGLEIVCLSATAQPERRWVFQDHTRTDREARGVCYLDVLPDRTGDGVGEILVTPRDPFLYVLDGARGTRLVAASLPGRLPVSGLSRVIGDRFLCLQADCVGSLSLGEGAIEWRCETPWDGSVADLAGDGDFEVVAPEPESWKVLDARTGEPAGGPSLPSPTGSTACSGALAWDDLDGDGALELLFVSPDKRLHAIRPRDGRLLWTFDGPVISVIPDPEALLARGAEMLWRLDETTGEPLWAVSGERSASQEFTLADWDGDGQSEILDVFADEGVICLDLAGKRLWLLSMPGKGSVAGVIGDGDGDGLPEFLIQQPSSLARVRGPRVLWTTPAAEAPARASPRLADVSGDRKPEAIVVGHWSSDGYRRVACLDGASGRVLWEHPVASYNYRAAGVADLTGDGIPDVVVPAQRPGDPEVGDVFLVAALEGATGRVLWETTFPGSFHVYCDMALGDLNGDGVPDVAFHTYQSKEILALDGKDGHVLWRVPTDAENMGGVAIADLDGDGRLDVVAPSQDENVYALRGAGGEVLWKKPIGDGGSRAVPGLGDLTGDGLPEVLIADRQGNLLVLAGKTGEKLREVRGAGDAAARELGAPVVVDAGDGRGPWILAPSATGAGLVALSWKDRGPVWQFAQGKGVIGSPAVADLDSDGRREVVVAVSVPRDDEDSAQVHVLDFETGAPLWHVTLECKTIDASPAVADLDGDGILDILVAAHDRRVHAVSGLATRAARRRSR